MGELRDFYSVGFISFIGGTFIKKGGHNPLEAALQRNLVLFGPNYFNIKDSANFLIDNDVAFVVDSEKEFLEKTIFLISNWEMTKEKAKNAAKLVGEKKGSIKKIEKVISHFIWSE